jgi:hypothetical protein
MSKLLLERLPGMATQGRRRIVLALICVVSLLWLPFARSAEMTLAGFAFAGDYKSATSRFPYSFKTFEKLKGNNSLSKQALDRGRNVNNPAIDIRTPESLVNLRRSDQAPMAVLLLTDEIASSGNYGAYEKKGAVNLCFEQGKELRESVAREKCNDTYPFLSAF